MKKWLVSETPARPGPRERTIVGYQFTLAAVALVVTASATNLPAADSSSKVTVDLLTGQTQSGIFESLTAKELRIRTTTIAAVPRARVFRIDFPPKKTTPTAAFVYLSNGDRISVTATKSDGEDLHGEWSNLPDKPRVKIPLLYVRGLIVQRGKQRSRLSPATLFRAGQKLDLVLLANGDKVSGRLASFGEKTIKMRNAAAEIARSSVIAVAFDPRFLDKPKTPAERVLVALRDGSRFTVSKVVSNKDALIIETNWGAKVAVPIAQLASLHFLGKHADPLSERTPTSTTHAPFIAGQRKPVFNRNVLGGPLRLREKEYAIGMGMSTRTRVEYELKGDEKYFRATIGVDDTAKGRGSVVFRVELDGKTVFKSPVLTGKSKPLALKPIPVKGGKRLTFIADYGPRGDLLDYANWCDAILIR